MRKPFVVLNYVLCRAWIRLRCSWLKLFPEEEAQAVILEGGALKDPMGLECSLVSFMFLLTQDKPGCLSSGWTAAY